MAVTARLEVRVQPESKARIEHAAALLHTPVSEFVRTAVEARVEQVMAEHEEHTRVPADFYDDLFAVLDVPAQQSNPLARAAQRARDTVVRTER